MPIAAKKDTWCISDEHSFFECYGDFNDWFNGEDGQEYRIKYGLTTITHPSKALYAGDKEAYLQTLNRYRDARTYEVLSSDNLKELCDGSTHWYERNVSRFEQLRDSVLDKQVVPFIGAGISVAAGFPTWADHLRQQGRTAGISQAEVEQMLQQGAYEDIVGLIEQRRSRDVFVQEIKDVFSRAPTLNAHDAVFRISELFQNTLITTNYDRTLEQTFDNGARSVQLVGSDNPMEDPDVDKTTIIKLHGSIKRAQTCILSKAQYDQAYGGEEIDLTLPIPKLLSYYYKTSSLLFLGCSLNRDRTMQVFKAIKGEMGDQDKPPHFSIEEAPPTEEEIQERNAYLARVGITPIWFPAGAFYILRHLRNEVRFYSGDW